MKAKRPGGGYIFHGGCDGCTQHMSVCPSCQYMEADWTLPDMNPAHETEKQEKHRMVQLAKSLAKRLPRKKNKLCLIFNKKDS